MAKYAIVDRNGIIIRVFETSEALANPPPHFIQVADNTNNEIVGRACTEVGLVLNAGISTMSTMSTENTTTDPEDIYTAWISTYEVGRKSDMNDKLEYWMQDVEDTLSDKADANHTHSGYASSDHTHSGYANASHTHTIANITNLQTTLDGKAASGHTHSTATTSANGLMSTTDKSKLDGMVFATVSEVETYLAI